MRIAFGLMAAISLSLPAAALASETITYTYDAQGRLIKSEHSGTVNNGAETTYTFDNADNRTNVTTIKGVNKVVVVPINGMTVIPIPDP